MLRLIGVLCFVALLHTPATAGKKDTDFVKLREQILSLTGGRIERLAEQIQLVFVSIDRNGDGITREEIAASRDFDNAGVRAMRLSEAIRQVAQADLDANAVVTRAEIETYTRYSSSRNHMYSGTDAAAAERVKQVVDRATEDFLGRYDINQNGKIEMTEVIAAPTDKLTRKSVVTETRRMNSHLAAAEALMGFDTDKNGAVSQLEAMAAIAKAFESYKPACSESCSPN